MSAHLYVFFFPPNVLCNAYMPLEAGIVHEGSFFHATQWVPKEMGRSKKGSVQLRDANNEELIRAPWLPDMMVWEDWDREARANCGRWEGLFPVDSLMTSCVVSTTMPIIYTHPENYGDIICIVVTTPSDLGRAAFMYHSRRISTDQGWMNGRVPIQ